MRIGIVGPINPAEFKEYFSDPNVPEMHLNASSVQALIKSFLDAGHVVYVFTINEVNVYQEFISEKLKVFAVPFRLVPRTRIFQVYQVLQLRKVIKKHLSEINVIHAQWTYEYAYAAMAFAKVKPVFCTVRDWCPYIMSVMSKSFLGVLGWKIKYFMFRRIMSNKDVLLIANSNYTYSRIKSSYPTREAVIIPNSIRKDYILTHKVNYSKKIKLISIANGIFDPRKNIVTLLKSFMALRQRYPDAVLTIVGKYDADYPVYLQWKAEGLLEGVVTTGQLNHKEVIDELDQSTILIHPSLEETFGNILLEAMARRIPVIGGVDSGAVPMVLGGGKYGLCCDITSPNKILEAVVELLDEKKYNTIINEATSHLLSSYASDVVCEMHINTYSRYV